MKLVRIIELLDCFLVLITNEDTNPILSEPAMLLVSFLPCTDLDTIYRIRSSSSISLI